MTTDKSNTASDPQPAELAEQQGNAPIDVTDPWRGLYQAARLPAPTDYGDIAHPDIPSWPDDREDALDKLVHAQGFDFHIVAGDFTEAALEDADELYWQEMRAWNPEAPEGEWRLAWKGDTEDGPYAWFVRPMALRPEPAALAAHHPVSSSTAEDCSVVAASQQGLPAAWYVFADTEHWVTLDEDEAEENRDEGCQVRPLVFGDIAAPPAQGIDQGQQQDAARWRAIAPLLSVEWDEDEQLKRWTWIDFKGDAPAIPSPTRQEYASVDEAVDALIDQRDAAPGAGSRTDHLLDRRNRLMNSYGNGDREDAALDEQIAKIDAELAGSQRDAAPGVGNG